MPASVRHVVVALVLLAMLVPLRAGTALAQDGVELYQSDAFDYFFFYDATIWELVDQASELETDYVLFSDGDIWVSYLALDAPGVSAGECLEGLLASFADDPSIESVEALTHEGGPPDIRDVGSVASVELVVTAEGSDGRFKLATYERCEELTPGVSLLYTSVNVPAASHNAGRRFETPWLQGYLPRDEWDDERAPVPVLTGSGEHSGSLQTTISCRDRPVEVVARSFGGGGNFVIDPAGFVVVYDSGESLYVPVEWLAPELPATSVLVLEPGEFALLTLEIPDTDYEILYAPPDGPPVVIGERRGVCSAPAAVANPVAIDMDE
jgi:hypothetical protein